jgi:hypothetical protein
LPFFLLLLLLLFGFYLSFVVVFVFPFLIKIYSLYRGIHYDNSK